MTRKYTIASLFAAALSLSACAGVDLDPNGQVVADEVPEVQQDPESS